MIISFNINSALPLDINMELKTSSKWITPVCSWELSGQERYVIFMKNKENHGVKELYSLYVDRFASNYVMCV